MHQPRDAHSESQSDTPPARLTLTDDQPMTRRDRQRNWPQPSSGQTAALEACVVGGHEHHVLPRRQRRAACEGDRVAVGQATQVHLTAVVVLGSVAHAVDGCPSVELAQLVMQRGGDRPPFYAPPLVERIGRVCRLESNLLQALAVLPYSTTSTLLRVTAR